MSHGSEEGDNYWPGYVDALTSMVQVLAFVMMMLAMAVFVLSQSVSKHAVEAIAKAVNAEVKPNADVKQLTQAVMEKLSDLRGSARDEHVEKPPEPIAPPPAVRAEPTTRPETEKATDLRFAGPKIQPDRTAIEAPPGAPNMSISFEDRSFKIESDKAQGISNFIGDSNAAGKTPTVIVNAFAYSGEGAVSEARRLAYYRGMMARKQLIDAKVKAEDIRIVVNDTTDKGKGSTVELILAGRAGH
jgi:hypothetical protein